MNSSSTYRLDVSVAVLNSRKINEQERMFFLRLMMLCRHYGAARQTSETLSAWTGRSRATVDRWIKKFGDLGWIVVTDTPTKGGTRREIRLAEDEVYNNADPAPIPEDEDWEDSPKDSRPSPVRSGTPHQCGAHIDGLESPDGSKNGVSSNCKEKVAKATRPKSPFTPAPDDFKEFGKYRDLANRVYQTPPRAHDGPKRLAVLKRFLDHYERFYRGIYGHYETDCKRLAAICSDPVLTKDELVRRVDCYFREAEDNNKAQVRISWFCDSHNKFSGGSAAVPTRPAIPETHKLTPQPRPATSPIDGSHKTPGAIPARGTSGKEKESGAYPDPENPPENMTPEETVAYIDAFAATIGLNRVGGEG